MIVYRRTRNQPARSVLYQMLDAELVRRRKRRRREQGIPPRNISERFMRRYPAAWQRMLADIELEQEDRRMARSAEIY